MVTSYVQWSSNDRLSKGMELNLPEQSVSLPILAYKSILHCSARYPGYVVLKYDSLFIILMM